MAFRIRYSVAVEYIPPGVGPMGGTGASLPGMAPTGVGPTKMLFNAAGGQTSPTFTASDVTTLTNAMAADIAAQMNVPATLAQIAAFATGGS
jgi:hypothetical protein